MLVLHFNIVYLSLSNLMSILHTINILHLHTSSPFYNFVFFLSFYPLFHCAIWLVVRHVIFLHLSTTHILYSRMILIALIHLLHTNSACHKLSSFQNTPYDAGVSEPLKKQISLPGCRFSLFSCQDVKTRCAIKMVVGGREPSSSVTTQRAGWSFVLMCVVCGQGNYKCRNERVVQQSS